MRKGVPERRSRVAAQGVGILVAALLLASFRPSLWWPEAPVQAGDTPTDASRANSAVANVNEGVPIALAVDKGQARCILPTRGPRDRTLVIVSALSRDVGPFPVLIQAVARIPRDAVAPRCTTDGPVATPRLFPVNATGTANATAALPPSPRIPPQTRSFQLLTRAGDVASAESYESVPGVLRGIGRNVQVYVDTNDVALVQGATIQDVIHTFDAKVLPLACQRLGSALDTDRDGRFTIFFSSKLGRLAGGKTSVDGFVRGADFDCEMPEPLSNHCDMMYLNSAVSAGPYLRTLVAHEYTHAITFSAKSFDRLGQRRECHEEGWLDEAIAHLVEDLHDFSRSNLDYRVSAYLSQPERYRLVVDDYYAAQLFRSHGNRGATYLFMRWCMDQFGPDFPGSLIRNPESGLKNLEQTTGRTFASLFRDWTLALYFSGMDPAHRGPKMFADLDLRNDWGSCPLAGPRTHNLAPGEPALCWNAEGTSCRFVIVEGASSGAVEMTVSGPADADLQVTAIPLPANLAELELRVDGGTDKPTSATQSQVQGGISAVIREKSGTPVRLTRLTWEPLVPAAEYGATRKNSDALSWDILKGMSPGNRMIPALGSLTLASRRGPDQSLINHPIILKAMGTDALGRRVTAWAVMGADAAPASPCVINMPNHLHAKNVASPGVAHDLRPISSD